MKPIIKIEDLSLSIQNQDVKVAILKAISLDVYPNEVLGLIGRSGSGKSMTAAVLMHFHDLISAEVSGQILYEHQGKYQNLLQSTPDQVNEYRRTFSSIVFQNPETALNPRMTCGYQIREAIDIRKGKISKKHEVEVKVLLNQVQINDPERIYQSYPHELSGGQLQRVVIAIALAKSPRLLIADELTSSLDKTTEREIINLLIRLKEEFDLSIVFISHDLKLVNQICQRVAIIDQGEIIAVSVTADLDQLDEHPLVKQLITAQSYPSIPAQDILRTKEEIISLSSVSKTYILSRSIFKKGERVLALDNINFSIYASEIVGLVGESGSGKSTLAKLLTGIEKADNGGISIYGKDIWKSWQSRRKDTSKLIQIVFQNPHQSLNPKQKVGDGIAEILRAHGTLRENIMDEALRLLSEVGLSDSFLIKYPAQMSGGEQQRICIAKALAVAPEVLICDECVSALDSVSKMEILNLLTKLNQDRKLSILFISHDINSISAICDRVAVLQNAKLIYVGSQVGLQDSDDPYIKGLLGHEHRAQT